MICGCFVLSPTRARRGGTPHAVREWSDLGRRDIDGLACEGSRRVSGSERVNRTSPEPSTLLVKVLGFTLEKHHDLTRDRMWQKMKNTSATAPMPLTIDGHPALQDELTGTEKGTNVVFLHTTVDDGDHFQQILAWTLKSRWQKQNELLREVTASFRSEK